MEYDFIDGNSWGYAAHGGPTLRSGSLETQAVFGFVRDIRALRIEHPASRVMVLWDGRREERFELLPEYKSNRESDPVKVAARNAYVEQRPYISRCLQHLGIPQTTVMNMEADDLAGFLVSKLARNPENKVRLHTGDGDWCQLVRKNVMWIDKRDDAKRITLDNFFDKTGYKNPLAFLEGKCLQGDTSDVIKGVGKIGKTRAPLVLAEWGSCREFWRACDAGKHVPTEGHMQHLASPEARALFHRNLRLMQLMKVAQPDPTKTRRIDGKLDPDQVQEVFEELAFNSLLKQLGLFLDPFQGRIK